MRSLIAPNLILTHESSLSLYSNKLRYKFNQFVSIQCFNVKMTEKTFSLTSSRFKFLFNWASVCIFINCSALLPLCTFLYSWSKLLSLSELSEAHFFSFLLLNAFFAKDIVQLPQTVNSKAICEQKLLNQQFQDKYGSIDYQAIFVNKKQSRQYKAGER